MSLTSGSDFSALRVNRHQQSRHPELATLEARLATFRDWPAGLEQRPAQLAEAGFFYMGTGDHVKCFCCDGALRNWEPQDEPWQEHARWFSRCNFLLTVKGPDFVSNVHSQFQVSGRVPEFVHLQTLRNERGSRLKERKLGACSKILQTL